MNPTARPTHATAVMDPIAVAETLRPGLSGWRDAVTRQAPRRSVGRRPKLAPTFRVPSPGAQPPVPFRKHLCAVLQLPRSASFVVSGGLAEAASSSPPDLALLRVVVHASRGFALVQTPVHRHPPDRMELSRLPGLAGFVLTDPWAPTLVGLAAKHVAALRNPCRAVDADEAGSSVAGLLDLVMRSGDGEDSVRTELMLLGLADPYLARHVMAALDHGFDDAN